MRKLTAVTKSFNVSQIVQVINLMTSISDKVVPSGHNGLLKSDQYSIIYSTIYEKLKLDNLINGYTFGEFGLLAKSGHDTPATNQVYEYTSYKYM